MSLRQSLSPDPPEEEEEDELESDAVELVRFTPVNEAVDPDFFTLTVVVATVVVSPAAAAAASPAVVLSRMTVSMTSASRPHNRRLYQSTCWSVKGTNTVSSRRDGRLIAT